MNKLINYHNTTFVFKVIHCRKYYEYLYIVHVLYKARDETRENLSDRVPNYGALRAIPHVK